MITMPAVRPTCSRRRPRSASACGRRCRCKGINGFPAPTTGSRTSSAPKRGRAVCSPTRTSGSAAGTVKSNPDSPQLPVRVRALKDGKLVYMAVPRLAEPDPFFVLDPDAPRRPARTRGVDQGAGALGAHGRVRRDDAGRPRRDRVRRGGGGRCAARQGRRLQRPRVRARRRGRARRRPTQSS